MDFVAMALAAAGLEPPTDRVLDGKDPTATLAGKASSPHEFMCWKYGSRAMAIRQGQYKLIKADKARTKEWQLFDLANDIGETYNLAAAKPELVQEMEGKFNEWLEDAKTGK
jgi:arylsulfatase A-like enzyme